MLPPEAVEEEDEELLEEDLPSVEDEVDPGVDSLPGVLLEEGLEDEVDLEDSEEDEVDRATEGSLDEEGELLRTRGVMGRWVRGRSSFFALSVFVFDFLFVIGVYV